MISFIVVLCSISSYSQENPISQQQFDSLAASPEMFRDDPFEFWHHPEKYGPDPEVLKAALTANRKLTGWHIYYSRIAHLKYFSKDRDSALFYAQKAIASYNELKKENDSFWEQEMLVYYIKGKRETAKREYDKSLVSMQMAIQLAKEHNLKRWEGPNHYAMARSHYNFGNDSIALKYFLIVAEDSIHLSNPRAFIATHAILGSIYKELEENELAKKHVLSAIEVSEKSDYKANLFPLYSAMGSIYREENNKDSLHIYYTKANDRFENFDRHSPDKIVGWDYAYLLNKSYLNLEKGALVEAEKDIEMVIEYYVSKEKVHRVDKDNVIYASQLLGQIYEKQGNVTKYSQLLEITSNYLEKFREQKLKEDLENLEVQYQTREKDQSIAQLEKNKEQQEAIISQQRVINFGLAGLILLFTGIGVLLWRQRKLKNLYEKETLEQQLLRAQMNPHFTFNTLSVIQNMIEKDPKRAKAYLTKFSRVLVSVFESSTSNYVPLEKELKSLKEYIDLQRIRFPESFDYQVELNDIDAETLFVPGMMLQPIIENSIAHGFEGIDYPGKISLILKKDESSISCSIEDNGRGLTDTEFSKDRPSSTQLISNFLNKVTKKAFTVLDKKDTFKDETGVIVEFSIPYKLSLND